MLTQPIRLLIADDEESIRSTLADYFTSDPRFSVIAAAADANSAASLAEEFQPDVALLGVRMPGGGGIRAAQAIRLAAPGTRIVALSAQHDLDAVLEMVGAGAIGYVVKGSNPQNIMEAVLNAAQGLSTLSPAVAGRVVDAVRLKLQDELNVRTAQEAKLHRVEAALRGDEVRIAYQPMWDLRSHEVVGYEALTRFTSEPQRSPDEWFADAADCGKTAALEMTCVRHALEGCRALAGCGSVSLNLSPAALLSPEFDRSLLRNPEYGVVIEITEHAPVVDYDELNGELNHLRAGGIRVAVDDAGSGYASFRHILNLAPDIIKLDLSLTRGIDRDPKRQALAKALIAFAEASGATVVGEGIETTAELETLTSLRVALGQGYLLGRPEIPAAPKALPPVWPLGRSVQRSK